MRFFAIALAAALAACATPPPAPIAHHLPRPDAPATPPPTVSIADGQLALVGLPAVAADGSLVVIAQEVHEPARGVPALTLIERDPLDREIARHYVLGFDDNDEPGAAMTARFAEANRWLAAQHAAHHLVPMRALAMTEIDGPTRHRRADGDGISIDWRPGQLAISRGGAAPFVHATPSDWLVADHPMYAGATEMCSNEAFLLGASVDLDRAIAVLKIAYMGTDTCWEPVAQDRVVHW